MNVPRKTTTNVYLYDPLDRLTGAHLAQRFYNGTRIATEIQNNRKICFFEHEAMPLAELHPGGTNTLLATDQQTSALNAVSAEISQPQSYSPYGHRPTTNGLIPLQGFNGERPDSATGHYLLGQGYRAFNPILMRFNSPDSWSPFGKGGINSYAYCGGDPINKTDPSGHAVFAFFKGFIKKLSLSKGHAGPIDSLVNDRLMNPLGKKVITFSNIKKIMPDILIGTEHKTDGTLRLNISAHGGYDPIRGGHLINEGKPISPETIYKIIGSEKLSSFSSIRVIACFSADGARNGFSKKLADLTRLPVKGYLSVLGVENDLIDIYSGFSGILGRHIKATDRVEIMKKSLVLKSARIRETRNANNFSYGPRTFFPD